MSQIIVTHSGARRIMRGLSPLKRRSILATHWKCGMALALRNTLLFGTAMRRFEPPAGTIVLCDMSLQVRYEFTIKGSLLTYLSNILTVTMPRSACVASRTAIPCVSLAATYVNSRLVQRNSSVYDAENY